jgi:hypothetical protein
MQFINIIVHSTQDMNFRVHLQYEFTQLGLDKYLENKLRFNESDRLQIQLQAYLDNQFDVQQLLEDADTKNETLLEMDKLKEELAIEREKFNKTQDDHLNKITELQNEILETRKEIDLLTRERDDMNVTIDTLKRISKTGQAHSSPFPSSLNNSSNNSVLTNTSPTLVPAPPPPPPPPGPPPPPPPPMFNKQANIPPPPPAMGESLNLKSAIKTKYRLPNLNWIALKPQQVKGTIFCELDDEKLMKIIDFNSFEEMFKMGNLHLNGLDGVYASGSSTNGMGSPLRNRKQSKKPENITLLEPQRQRNLGFYFIFTCRVLASLAFINHLTTLNRLICPKQTKSLLIAFLILITQN